MRCDLTLISNMFIIFVTSVDCNQSPFLVKSLDYRYIYKFWTEVLADCFLGNFLQCFLIQTALKVGYR